MIQNGLFFALGFLCAILIALAAAPAIWRRAELLTRRRIEASLPMTSDEIAAERDRVRAGHAMAIRKVEIEGRRAADRASKLAIDLARRHEELKALQAQNDALLASIAGLETEQERLGAQLTERIATIEALGEKLSQAASQIETNAQHLDALATSADEAKLLASDRQVRIIAIEGDVERLEGDLAVALSARKDSEKRLREIMADNKAAQEALRNERRRLTDGERKIERLMATVSDREDRLERRERERARLRDDLKSTDTRRREAEAALAEARAEIFRLEAQIAGGRVPAEDEPRMAERRRIEERLALLTRENKKLRTELAASEQAAGAQDADASLREAVAELAARVVRATAEAEGPSSPIHAILAATPRATEGPSPAPSLAQRIAAASNPQPATTG